MNVTSVRVTLVEEGGWTDVSVAAGTPLRALLEARTGAAVPDNALVSTASGTPAPLDAVFGRDLEDGAMLLVGGRATGRHAARRLFSARSGSRPARYGLDAASVVLVALLLLALGWHSVLATNDERLPMPARMGAAGLAAALLLARMIPTRKHLSSLHEAVAVLPLPLLGAATGVLLAPADVLQPTTMAALLTAWGAGAAALAVWLRLRSVCAATGARAWTVAAIIVSAVLAFGIPRAPVAVIVLAIGAVIITLVPTAALSSIPDQQLLDLSEQRAGSRGVRAPMMRPPDEVSRGRTSRTLAQAESVSISVGVVIAVVVVACSPAAVSIALGSNAAAWGARVELALVAALLLLHPRTARSHTERILPRLAVGIAAIISILTSGSQPGTMTFNLLMGIAALAGLVSGVIMLSSLGRRRSAWWGRFGDILGSISGLLALPAAVVAAGIIDFMRQL